MGHGAQAPGEDELRVSLVLDDPAFRAQRALGLIPPAGFGVGRRALLFALVTWLPVAAWALLARRALPGSVAEPLLEHFGVHVRCLVAIPLLVAAEAVAHARMLRVVPYFVRSGLVAAADRARFREVVGGVLRLRDATLPWIGIVGIVAAWTVFAPTTHLGHELVWAAEGPPEHPGLGFGGWWVLLVVRPLFIAFLLAWLWRIGLLAILFARIANLDLAIVPTHPDRAGGLGFLENVPSAFALVAFAASAVVASGWAHDVVYHGVSVDSLRLPMIALAVVAVLLFLAPLLVFVRVLAPAKRQALLDYGALVGEHGRGVRRRWILGEPVPDADVLAAPEIGPVADTISLYEAVRKMRVAPIGLIALASVLLPTALPILVVLALQIPIRSILLGLLKALA